MSDSAINIHKAATGCAVCHKWCQKNIFTLPQYKENLYIFIKLISFGEHILRRKMANGTSSSSCREKMSLQIYHVKMHRACKLIKNHHSIDLKLTVYLIDTRYILIQHAVTKKAATTREKNQSEMKLPIKNMFNYLIMHEIERRKKESDY